MSQSNKLKVKGRIEEDRSIREPYEDMSGFNEISGSLKGLLVQMVEAGDDCVGLLILHNQKEGTWSYTTNLEDPDEVCVVLEEITEMVKDDRSTGDRTMH